MNEALFFSFRKPPDWKRGISYQLEANKTGLSLVQEQMYRHTHRHPITHPHLSELIDVAVDAVGHWFLLDERGSIWRTDLTSGHMEVVYHLSSDEADKRKCSRIATIQEGFIVLQSDESRAEIQCLSSDQAQIKWKVSEWKGQAIRVYDFAASQSGDILVFASLENQEGLCLLRFSASGKALDRIELPHYNESDPLDMFTDRFEMITDSYDQGWLLDKEQQRLMQIHLQTNTISVIPTEQLTSSMVTMCNADPDTLWVMLRGDDRNILPSLIRLHQDGTIFEEVSLGSGMGDRLFAGHRSLYVWNAEDQCIHRLQLTTEIAVWKPFGRRLGVWMSDSLDSGAAETEWHKLVLQASEYNDTRINIRYFASDTKEIVLGHERVNLDTYITDATIGAETKLSNLSHIWSKPLHDPEDALLLNAKGRYLWVYVEMMGSEQHSPAIHSLEVHFPRLSFLENLPSIYQRDAASSEFLSRYLSIFQTLLDETDQQIQRVTQTFDANHVTGSSLNWLLSWIGIQAEDNWTEDQLKQLLKQAPVIYGMRGTKYAMEVLISIFTGEKPIILEYEQVKPLKEHPELGELSERLYAADPHVFNVLVKPEHVGTEKDRITLQQLIDATKPAFSTGKLIVLQPWVYMDLHSYLGMNTVLSEPTLLTLDGRSSMPHHTITIDVGPDNRVDQHTRLGLDSRLE